MISKSKEIEKMQKGLELLKVLKKLNLDENYRSLQ